MEDQPQEEFSEKETQEGLNLEEELEADQILNEELDSDDFDDDEDYDDEDYDDEDYEDEDIEEKKPAVVITLQNWAIPIVALVMLLIGIAAGYSGKDLIAYLSRDAATPTVTEDLSAEATEVALGEVSLPTVTPSEPTEEELAQLMAFLVSQTTQFIGEEDAPITIIEFSDFQWPFCGRWAADAGRQIEETYVADGEVRFGYFHFAFLGSESTWAAEASECAGEQDAFWEYHDLLFESQSGENQGAFNQDNLKQFAADLDLDTDAFNECLDSGKYTELINNMTATAQQLGVRSTPTFAVNGMAIVGAQTFDYFQQVIEGELSSE